MSSTIARLFRSKADVGWARDAERRRAQAEEALAQFRVFADAPEVVEVLLQEVRDMQVRQRPKPPRQTAEERMWADAAKTPALALRPHQAEHIERLCEVLRHSYLALDATQTGGGKTLAAVEVAKRSGYDALFVVTIAKHEEVWQRTARRQGMRSVVCMSYERLCGNKRVPPRHGYVERQERVDHAAYVAGAKLHELLAMHRVLLVVDEGQRATNGRDRTHAIAAIVRAMFGTRTVEQRMAQVDRRHAMMVSSAVLADKKEEVLHVMQYTGLLPSMATGIRDMGFTVTGFRGQEHQIALAASGDAPDLFKWCCHLDRAKSDAAREYHLRYQERDRVCTQRSDGARRSDRQTEFLYELFVAVVRPRLKSAMVDPVGPRKQVRNVFGRWGTRDEFTAFQAAVSALHHARVLQVVARDQDQHAAAMVAIGAARQKEDSAKVPLLVRFAEHVLTADPLCRMVIGVHYMRDVDALVHALRDRAPLTLVGKLTAEQKRAIQAQFTAVPLPGAPFARLIVGTMAAMAEGISLNDTSGRHTVHLVGLPSFHAKMSKQFEGRSERVTTVGECPVHWMYGRATFGDLPPTEASARMPVEEGREERLLRSLARKAAVMEDMAREQKEQGEPFAEDYACVQEYRAGEFRLVQLAPYCEGIVGQKRAASASDDNPAKRSIIVIDDSEERQPHSMQPVIVAPVPRRIPPPPPPPVLVPCTDSRPESVRVNGNWVRVCRCVVPCLERSRTSTSDYALASEQIARRRRNRERQLRQQVQLPRPLSTVPEEEQEPEQEPPQDYAQWKASEEQKRAQRMEEARALSAQPWKASGRD